MKMSMIALVLAVFLVAQPSALALQTTVGDLVDSLCPDAELRLNQNVLLKTALGLAKDVAIEVPDSGTPVLFAPSDAALNAALPKLGLTVVELAGKPELIADILSLHLAYATSPDATTATTINDKEVMFMLANAPATLANFLTAADPTSRSVMQGSTVAMVEDAVACTNGPVAIFTDTVFLPSAAPPPSVPTPAPAPVPAPAPAPPAKPTFGTLIPADCTEVNALLGASDLAILTKTILPLIADVPVDVPEGIAVLVAPTDKAFQDVLTSGVDPNLVNNLTIVTELIKQHIAVAETLESTTGTTLTGETITFMEGPAEIPLAALPTALDGEISDPTQTANVLASASCKNALFAFKVDSVLLPQAFEPVAPAPGPTAPLVPSPAPAPASSAASAAVSMAAVLAGIFAALV